MMKSCILFFLGGVAATVAICAASQCPKTRELWEKGLDKGKQAKKKAMDALGHIKEEATSWGSEAKDKLAQKFAEHAPQHAGEMR